ncbi:hypothetical protein ACF09C_30915 [Streptomyces sp. NPDC014870]|uniref:hypothetical protein n=1 Tax=Streptomyces sp. NPDC014870 TaxID=3364925 RepID=UPI0036F64190
MAVRKGVVAFAALLGALCGATATAGVTLALGENATPSVDSRAEVPSTREESVRRWEVALSKSGKSLPADVNEMTDREIYEAMWAEWRKYVVPEKQPNRLVD